MTGTTDYRKGRDGKPVALEHRAATEDGRRYSPSTARNRDVIAEAFCELAGQSGKVLEIASGTGEHGAHLTRKFPGLDWTYSDIDELSLKSQAAWRAAADHDRLHGPIRVDAIQADWAEAERPGPWDIIVCINMIHIAPVEALQGMISGAGRLLSPDGYLFLYGPFAREGRIAPSNQAFDDSLKSRNPAWGVRDLDRDVCPLAAHAGLSLAGVLEMPANNLSVIFKR